jgi:hypothetical protein
MTDTIADPAVPSGMALRLQEILRDTRGAEGLTLRYRFVAPDLAARRGVDQGKALLADITHLCTGYALPQLAGLTPAPSQIIISVSEVETVFGEANPDTIQVFEGFRPEGATCIWEPF